MNLLFLNIKLFSSYSNKEDLSKIIKIINYLQEKLKKFFPRTIKNLKIFDLEKGIKKSNIILSDPIGYLEFLNLIINSKLILTDSGGIQEEASYLNIPTLNLRENTERPITVENGTNTVIGTDFKKVKQYINDILANRYKNAQKIEKWDGKASKRITEILKRKSNL